MKRLQLPKNKFDKFALNISFIIIWFLLSFIIWYCIWQGLMSIYPNHKILTKLWTESIIFPISTVFQLLFIVPSFLITRFIWFKRILIRPKITRSKN